jgi:hypothetical protein
MIRRVVVTCLLVALAGCRPKPAPIVLVDPALAILVPPDAVLLAGVRMKQLRESGIDPRKDVWELLITSDGKDTVVMARGKFSELGMEPKLEREGVRRFAYWR